jgi:hypothetical protein
MHTSLLRLQDALELEGSTYEPCKWVVWSPPHSRTRSPHRRSGLVDGRRRLPRSPPRVPGPPAGQQLEAGYLTYNDWRVLRALEGLAKRLWVYLESQTFKRADLGEGAVALQLGPPMWQALGVTTEHAPLPDDC